MPVSATASIRSMCASRKSFVSETACRSNRWWKHLIFSTLQTCWALRNPTIPDSGMSWVHPALASPSRRQAECLAPAVPEHFSLRLASRSDSKEFRKKSVTRGSHSGWLAKYKGTSIGEITAAASTGNWSAYSHGPHSRRDYRSRHIPDSGRDGEITRLTSLATDCLARYWRPFVVWGALLWRVGSEISRSRRRLCLPARGGWPSAGSSL